MTDAVTKTRDLVVTRIKEPSRWKVVILNDDVTPMELVIAILISIFRHSEEDAKTLTLKIHTEGRAIAGIYPFEIAEQKAVDATNIAKNNNSPLKIQLEEN